MKFRDRSLPISSGTNTNDISFARLFWIPRDPMRLIDRQLSRYLRTQGTLASTKFDRYYDGRDKSTCRRYRSTYDFIIIIIIYNDRLRIKDQKLLN